MLVHSLCSSSFRPTHSFFSEVFLPLFSAFRSCSLFSHFFHSFRSIFFRVQTYSVHSMCNSQINYNHGELHNTRSTTSKALLLYMHLTHMTRLSVKCDTIFARAKQAMKSLAKGTLRSRVTTLGANVPTFRGRTTTLSIKSESPLDSLRPECVVELKTPLAKHFSSHFNSEQFFVAFFL